jgi:hypothetical protein
VGERKRKWERERERGRKVEKVGVRKREKGRESRRKEGGKCLLIRRHFIS